MCTIDFPFISLFERKKIAKEWLWFFGSIQKPWDKSGSFNVTERPRWSFNSSSGRVSTVWRAVDRGEGVIRSAGLSVCWPGRRARGARPLSIYHPPSQLSLSDLVLVFPLFSTRPPSPSSCSPSFFNPHWLVRWREPKGGKS